MHYAWFISILTWTVLTAGVLALAAWRASDAAIRAHLVVSFTRRS